MKRKYILLRNSLRDFLRRLIKYFLTGIGDCSIDNIFDLGLIALIHMLEVAGTARNKTRKPR